MWPSRWQIMACRSILSPAFPKMILAKPVSNFLRQYGVGVDKIVRGGERLGIYFLEMGSMQRGSKVVYDRAHSAISTIEPGMIDWQTVFADADWFHWTGITPAISGGPPRFAWKLSKPPKKWV